MNSKSGSESTPKRSSQGQLILYHGMKLSTMVKLFALKPSLRPSRIIRLGLMPFWGVYNSIWAGIENFFYAKKIRETELAGPPIFILGYWRSGTTLLHTLMTQDSRYNFPNLYQTVFPWHFLCTEKVFTSMTGWMVPKSRPMDNVEVHWNVPQEDEFAICTMCLISPYTLPLRPFDQEEWTRSFHIDDLSPEDRKTWEDSILHFMKKLTLRSPKPLVMKSPSHTYRVKALLKLFPDAKFIHIARHPFDVFNSTLHLRSTMIEENTLGSSFHPNPEESVLATFMEAYRTYEAERDLIPKENLTEVKYENLAQNPMAEIERIYKELQLGDFEFVRKTLEEKLVNHKDYKKNRFGRDPHWQQRVYEYCKEFYDRFGYVSPDQEKETAAA